MTHIQKFDIELPSGFAKKYGSEFVVQVYEKIIEELKNNTEYSVSSMQNGGLRIDISEDATDSINITCADLTKKAEAATTTTRDGWKTIKVDGFKLTLKKVPLAPKRDPSFDSVVIENLVGKLKEMMEATKKQTLKMGECHLKTNNKNQHEVVNELNDDEHAYSVINDDEIVEVPMLSSNKRHLETEEGKKKADDVWKDYVPTDVNTKLKYNFHQERNIPSLNTVAPQILVFVLSILHSGCFYEMDWKFIGLNTSNEFIVLPTAVFPDGANEETTKDLIRLMCRKVVNSMNDRCKDPSFLVFIDILNKIDVMDLPTLSAFIERKMATMMNKKHKI